jgi:cytochrome c551/c552
MLGPSLRAISATTEEKKMDALEETAAEVEKGWLAECSEVDMKQQLNACPSNKKAR